MISKIGISRGEVVVRWRIMVSFAKNSGKGGRPVRVRRRRIRSQVGAGFIFLVGEVDVLEVALRLFKRIIRSVSVVKYRVM